MVKPAAPGPAIQVQLVLIHQIPLLADVEIEMPYGAIVALSGRLEVARLEELVTLLSKLVGLL